MATYNEYEDKEALIENPSIPDINKVKADDMNYIKYNLPHISNEVDEDYRVNILYSKNILNSALYKENIYYNISGTTYTPATNNNYWSTEIQKCKANTTYYLNTNKKITTIIYLNGTTALSIEFENTSGQFTTPANCNGVLLNIAKSQIAYGTDLIASKEQNPSYEPYITPSIYVDNEEIYKLLKETIDISSYKSNNVGTITRAKVIRNDNIYYFNMDFNITTSGNTITLFTGTPIQPSDTSNLIAVNDNGETSRVYIQTNGNITMQRVPTANVTYHIVGCIIV